ncbi:beta-glucan synthesis-associated [Pyrrhoderma noxium]|uniref:Beta-glucan synthesis-associated n=1 Tax=Pyrrhoderma noxium TaxID=2282107 RepID=A0A286UR68_9AGAM|nr:beta-glucan synthesis-associated [Pyrrhoderma noxium]
MHGVRVVDMGLSFRPRGKFDKALIIVADALMKILHQYDNTILGDEDNQIPPPSFRLSLPSCLLQDANSTIALTHPLLVLRQKASSLNLGETPYSAALHPSGASVAPSISDKFSLSPDPSSWGAAIEPTFVEPDDYLHNPDPRRDRKLDKGGSVFTGRGFANLGCLFILAAGLVTLFGGYPLIIHFTKKNLSTLGGFNIGGTNASGQIAAIGNFGLIDSDTPKDVYTKTSYIDGSTQLELVFSDEFEQDGRSFYPGDDPYWEAVDLHYWGTNNMEWYDPAAITTKGGALRITLSKKETHELDYQGGMMSTWNKFCFTGGLLEASVTLPGANNIVGLWPAVWAMGNLGRAGYGATLDGMWPYTYDACDVGTAPNQTRNGLPVAATENGDASYDGVLSYLPGQRLSRCTCPGESHPGPMHSDGTFVGRSAPEIDVFEAQITGDPLEGQVSQSGQWAPFNEAYEWFNTTENLIITDTDMTFLNTYKGGVYQQATSGVTTTNQQCYELTGGCFSVYGFEYKPGFDDAYIGWISDDKLAWQINAGGLAADTAVEISARPIPQEPMYILVNLGMSTNFGDVDLDHLTFPTTMSVDYVRVYQDPNNKNVGCDPQDFPTQSYINQYIEAYSNPNLTTWEDDFKQTRIKSSYLGDC